MFTFGSILVGFVGVALGVLIVLKSFQLRNIVGLNAWAENFFGPGGTTTMYRAIGVLVILLSLFYSSGLLQTILRSVLGGLFGSFNSQ